MKQLKKIQDEFKVFLDNIIGIQGFIISSDMDGNPFFIVNVYERHYRKLKAKIPVEFQGITVKITKVKKVSFLTRAVNISKTSLLFPKNHNKFSLHSSYNT